MTTVKTNTLHIKEIPIPPKTIMVTFEKNNGVYKSYNEMFFEHEEFLEFFKPLVEYYEGVKNESSKR
jgi:hypothetical protein